MTLFAFIDGLHIFHICIVFDIALESFNKNCHLQRSTSYICMKDLIPSLKFMVPFHLTKWFRTLIKAAYNRRKWVCLKIFMWTLFVWITYYIIDKRFVPRKYVNNSITTIMLFVISVDFTVRVGESRMKPYIKMFDLRFCDIDE